MINILIPLAGKNQFFSEAFNGKTMIDNFSKREAIYSQ